MDVAVIRSSRRRKTVEAKLVGGVIELRIPAHMTAREEAHWVEEMKSRFARRAVADPVALEERARRLATRHGLPVPAEIVWSTRQRKRWGSCTPQTGRIRISEHLATYPEWVLDYVVVHELAHLVRPDHSADFWALVDRYPKAERARGYLMARSDCAAEH